MSRLSSVSRVVVSTELLRRTRAALRTFGERGLEGLVLWVGTIDAATASVLDAWVPPQNSISSEDGVGYFVTGETLSALNHLLADRKLRLLAQVHSHPTDAYHSYADDVGAIVTTEGGFSIVVPDFARAPMSVEGSAVYRLRQGEWCEMSAVEIRRVFAPAG